MFLTDIKITKGNDKKRFRAIIHNNVNNETRTIYFGQIGGSTYIDHGDDVKKRNYILRHRVREDWNQINAGSLSRYLLWEKKTLPEAIKNFGKIFKVNISM